MSDATPTSGIGPGEHTVCPTCPIGIALASGARAVAARDAQWRARIEALADEFARRESVNHDALDEYAEGTRDAWDLAESLTRALAAEGVPE